MSEYTLSYKFKFLCYVFLKIVQLRIKVFFTQEDNLLRLIKLTEETALLEKEFNKVFHNE